MDFYIGGQDALRWFHIVAMVYWLGGEWGVFQTSYHITNHRLPLDERKRHMETAYRIDILARTGILLLFPIGFHMGWNLGVHELGGPWLVGVWLLFGAWLALCWAAFFYRETDTGIRLTKLDEAGRYILIPALFILAISSFLGNGPFNQNWYAAKVFLFGWMLVIGLILRFVMRHWTVIFREIAINGPTQELEDRLTREITMSRYLAYIYWVGILSIAFLGATKPF